MQASTALMAALCACALLVAVYAATSLEIVTENPSHPGQCFQSRTGKFYKDGEEWQVPGECHEYKCRFPQIHGRGCGAVMGDPQCWVVRDPTKPHPDCCPTIKCP